MFINLSEYCIRCYVKSETEEISRAIDWKEDKRKEDTIDGLLEFTQRVP